jgi:hypothetical protein
VKNLYAIGEKSAGTLLYIPEEDEEDEEDADNPMMRVRDLDIDPEFLRSNLFEHHPIT